jgi:hypothetical protein
MEVAVDQWEAWWKETTSIPAKHVRPWEQLQASTFWKDIMQVGRVFESVVTYQIRQGDRIWFWHDVWLRGILRYEFPTIFQLASQPNESVTKHFVKGQWQIELTTTATGHALQELTTLMQPILPNQLDVPTSTHIDTGIFTTVSAYRYIHDSLNIRVQYNMLWRKL